MKKLEVNKLYQEILDANDQHPFLKLQLEIMSNKNQNRLSEASEAIELYTEVLKTKKSELIYYYRALNYGIINEDKMAIDDYSSVIKLNNTHEGALTNRASIYLKTHEYDKAVQDYSEALKIGSSYMTYLSRAECYFHLGQFEEANKDFQTAIALKKEYDETMKR